MAKNPDGTYSQVGFIKDADGNDVEFVKDKNGTVIFEKGFTREKSDVLPLQIDGIGKPLKNYTIYGNTVQNGTPTPDNPVEVQAVGDRTGNLIRIIPFSVTFGWGSSVIRDFLNTLDIGAYTISYNTKLLTRNDISDSSVYGIRLINEAGSIEHIRSWGAVNAGTVSKTSVKVTITEQNKGKFTNVYFYGCGMWSAGVTGNTQIYDFMLNEGETALPYEPYGYKIPITTESEDGMESITTPIYLDKPLYKIGDYADTLCYAEQKVERFVKELVLTGEETNNGDIEYNRFYFTIQDMCSEGVRLTKLFCTHYQNISDGRPIANVPNNSIYTGGGTDSQKVFIKTTDYTTVAGFKSYLAAQYAAGTPVTVYYILAESETESVTLPKIPTLDGVTVIDTATEVKPSKMDIKYKGV